MGPGLGPGIRRGARETRRNVSAVDWSCPLVRAQFVWLVAANAGSRVVKLDVTDTDRLREVLTSGEPWLVMCKNGNKGVERSLVVVEDAAHALYPGIRVGVLDCGATLPSGQTMFERLRVTETRGLTLFTVANGRKPSLVPAKAAAEASALTAHVQKVTTPSLLALRTTKDLRSCLQSRQCLVLLESRVFSPTETARVQFLTLRHRATQFAVLNTTFHAIQGLPAPLRRLLPRAALAATASSADAAAKHPWGGVVLQRLADGDFLATARSFPDRIEDTAVRSILLEAEAARTRAIVKAASAGRAASEDLGAAGTDGDDDDADAGAGAGGAGHVDSLAESAGAEDLGQYSARVHRDELEVVAAPKGTKKESAKSKASSKKSEAAGLEAEGGVETADAKAEASTSDEAAAATAAAAEETPAPKKKSSESKKSGKKGEGKKGEGKKGEKKAKKSAGAEEPSEEEAGAEESKKQKKKDDAPETELERTMRRIREREAKKKQREKERKRGGGGEREKEREKEREREQERERRARAEEAGRFFVDEDEGYDHSRQHEDSEVVELVDDHEDL